MGTVWLFELAHFSEHLKGLQPAEDHHEDFPVMHSGYPYMIYNDAPKIDNLKRLVADQYRDTPVTVMAANRPSR
jgi:peptide-methionine (S)-S-oxide reductase